MPQSATKKKKKKRQVALIPEPWFSYQEDNFESQIVIADSIVHYVPDTALSI